MDSVHVSLYRTSKKVYVYEHAEETHALVSTMVYKKDQKSQVREKAFSVDLGTFFPIL